MTEAASESVLCCGLWRDARLACYVARLTRLTTLLRLRYRALPHLFTQLRALLPLTPLCLQLLQPLPLRRRQPPLLLAPLQALLQLLCPSVAALLTL